MQVFKFTDNAMTTVLLVDDDRTYRKILEKKLENYFAASCKDDSGEMDNIEIVLAEDGKEAIGYLQKHPVALLVTDINMPKINGLKLLAYVKNYHPEIPCILMTAYGAAEIGKDVINDGVLYIQKPFQVDQMGKMILSALNIDASCSQRSGISLAGFLRLIEMEGQSCFVKVTTTSGDVGYFSFKDGELFDAVYADLKGEEAALKMIPMKSYKIELLELPERKLKKRIQATGLMPLISKAMDKT